MRIRPIPSWLIILHSSRTCFSVRQLIGIKIRQRLGTYKTFFQLKIFVHTINSGMHCDITKASNIKDVIGSDKDIPTVVMNQLKTCKPLSFVRHALSSAKISNPRTMNLTQGIKCVGVHTICLTRDKHRGIRVYRHPVVTWHGYTCPQTWLFVAKFCDQNEVPCAILGTQQQMRYHFHVDILYQNDRIFRTCSNVSDVSTVLKTSFVLVFARQSEKSETQIMQANNLLQRTPYLKEPQQYNHDHEVCDDTLQAMLEKKEEFDQQQ